MARGADVAATDAQRRAKAKYQRNNVKSVRLSFYAGNPEDDAMLAWLKSRGNMTGYLKDLVREDMERRGGVGND